MVECLFNMYSKCITYDKVNEELKQAYASVEWIRIVCSMCFKSYQIKRQRGGRIGLGVTV